MTSIARKRKTDPSDRVQVTSEILDRTPPRNLDAEKGVLGSILLAKAVNPRVAQIVRPEDFYDTANRTIFRHLLAMHKAGRGIDGTTVVHRLQEHSDYEHTGGGPYLAELTRCVPHAGHATYYAEIVRDLAWNRRKIEIGLQFVQDGYNGKPAAEGLEFAIQELGEIRVGTTNGGAVRTYRTLTCAELSAADYYTEYLIDWILVAGQPCILAGGKKTLKTSILIDLGISLATAGLFLGKFKVSRACRVLFMSGESGAATIAETLGRVAAVYGLDFAKITGLIISDELPLLGDEASMHALRKLLADHGIEVLILDPAYLCMQTAGNESSLFAMGKMLREIGDLCQECGVTLILAHHTNRRNKENPFQPPELDDIAFAGFQEFARQWILIGRREKYEPGSGDHRLWFNAGGSAGHSSLWALDIYEGAFDCYTRRQWEVNILKAEEARQFERERVSNERSEAKLQAQAKQIESMKSKLINALRKRPNGESKSQILALAGASGKLAGPAFEKLIEDGIFVPVNLYKSNHKTPKVGYQLNPDDPI